MLPNGGVLIDNLGKRGIGIPDSSEALELTFDDIYKYATNCKYKYSTHVHEDACAIIDALDNGEIVIDSYNDFQKMEREKSHFESSSQEKKQKDKDLGKIIKEGKKLKRHNKY